MVVGCWLIWRDIARRQIIRVSAACAPLFSRFPIHIDADWTIGRPSIHLRKLGVDNVRILMPVVNAHPHLPHVSHHSLNPQTKTRTTYLPKRAQPRQNTASNPRRVLPLRRREDLGPHILDGEALHLEQKTITEPLGHRSTTREHNVAEQRLAQVEIGAVYGVDDDLVHARVLEPDDLGVEKDFWSAETLGSDLCLSVLAGQPKVQSGQWGH